MKEMKDTLIKLQDGWIEEIRTDSHYSSGCDTCDYGSSYVNEFKIKTSTGEITIEIDTEYDYTVTEDYLMRLFLQNVDKIKQFTEGEFYDWLRKKVDEDVHEKNYGSGNRMTSEFKKVYF